ncbi:MAG TPA: hypothetical protein VM925_36015, partial [Labilithrix sp.]|nr:hypothetical protein [Labilithrix sp.]
TVHGVTNAMRYALAGLGHGEAKFLAEGLFHGSLALCQALAVIGLLRMRGIALVGGLFAGSFGAIVVAKLYLAAPLRLLGVGTELTVSLVALLALALPLFTRASARRLHPLDGEQGRLLACERVRADAANDRAPRHVGPRTERHGSVVALAHVHEGPAHGALDELERRRVVADDVHRDDTVVALDGEVAPMRGALGAR